MTTFPQDPLDVRRITINFSAWLGSGPVITTAAWVVETGLVDANETFTTTTATNYFSGGTENVEYEVAVTITTDDAVPRKKTQRFLIKIEKTFD